MSNDKTINNKTAIQSNYYLQQRYISGEINTDKISFEPDNSSRMYSDHNQDTIHKKYDIEALDKCINQNNVIKKIIDNIPVEKTINLPIEDVNKIYSYCMLIMRVNPFKTVSEMSESEEELSKAYNRLSKLTKIQMFSLITDYINLKEKEVKYFYRNLSITFKSDLLDELKKQGLYKDNKLF